MIEQTCQTCGEANEAQARFCANCGSRLEGADVEMVATQEAPLLEVEPMIETADTRPTPPTNGSEHDLSRKINEGTASRLGDLFEDRSPALEAGEKTQTTPQPGSRPPTASQTVAHQAVEGDKNATLNVPIFIEDQVCPLCSADLHSPEAKFCWNCGNPVTDQHENCRNCNNPIIPGASYCHHCGVRVEPIPTLILTMVENNQEYRIPKGSKVYMIGRTVPQQGIFVDLDLGPYGQRKVSRQHARFVLRDNKWYLEDMNSKAGTRVYNKQAEPLVPVLIEDSMVIYFADLKFKVNLSYS